MSETLFESHLQAVMMDASKLIALARFVQAGGTLGDLEKTLKLVMSELDVRKRAREGAPPGSGPPEEAHKSWTWDPSRIPWKSSSGSKGPYEQAQDPRNFEFQNLVKDLKEHKGSLVREGLYYWLFTDAEVVGRKKAK